MNPRRDRAAGKKPASRPKKAPAKKATAKKATAKKATAKKTPAKKTPAKKATAKKATAKKATAKKATANKAPAKKAPANKAPAKKATAKKATANKATAGSPAVRRGADAAPKPSLPATPAPGTGHRFTDGAAARRAAEATTRLQRPLTTLPSQPDAGPSLDPSECRSPRAGSVLTELKQREPQLARRLRAEVLAPALAALAQLARPRAYRRWISNWRMQRRSDIVDDYGLDPVVADRLRSLFEFLYRRYWRIEARGMANVPDHGPAIIVANHGGLIPYDATMLMYALRYDHPAHRTARPLIEDFLFHSPFLGVALNRIGGVRASQENARRLLDEGQLVVVFPEGLKGIGKVYRDRYRLQRFGRGGFVKLALQTDVPIIPAAVVGAEEIYPLLTKISWFTKSLGVPFLPVTPTFPWLGPLGALPLPSKWQMVFGEPIEPARELGDDAAGDRVLVNRIAEQVRGRIQSMIDDCLAQRTSVFFD